jgi:hypothetical protein
LRVSHNYYVMKSISWEEREPLSAYVPKFKVGDHVRWSLDPSSSESRFKHSKLLRIEDIKVTFTGTPKIRSAIERPAYKFSIVSGELFDVLNEGREILDSYWSAQLWDPWLELAPSLKRRGLRF